MTEVPAAFPEPETPGRGLVVIRNWLRPGGPYGRSVAAVRVVSARGALGLRAGAEGGSGRLSSRRCTVTRIEPRWAACIPIGRHVGLTTRSGHVVGAFGRRVAGIAPSEGRKPVVGACPRSGCTSVGPPTVSSTRRRPRAFASAKRGGAHPLAALANLPNGQGVGPGSSPSASACEGRRKRARLASAAAVAIDFSPGEGEAP